MKPECPRCHADISRRVGPSGQMERILTCFSVHFFRCQLCAHRYRRVTIGPDRPTATPDKRQFDRLSTHVHATIVRAQRQSEDVITDVSMGGCTLRTATPLAKGAFLHLGLRPFQHEPAILVETAMVRSVRPESVGLEFLEFESGHKERLTEFVRSLLAHEGASAMG